MQEFCEAEKKKKIMKWSHIIIVSWKKIGIPVGASCFRQGG